MTETVEFIRKLKILQQEHQSLRLRLPTRPRPHLAQTLALTRRARCFPAQSHQLTRIFTYSATQTRHWLNESLR